MFFEIGKINDVNKFVQLRASNMGITFPVEESQFFSAILESIKDARINNGKDPMYTQGEDIDPEDKKAIMEAVQGFVVAESERLVNRAKANDPKVKNIKNSAEYFATYADFFYVRAMQQLGCPNMPIFMFDGGFRKTIEESAVSVHAAKNNFANLSTKDAYTRQRYANAVDIDKAFKVIFDDIDKKIYAPKGVGILMAQYKALKMRQANHGAIWRFFHSTENKARTAMLNKLDTYIRKALPEDLKGIDLDKAIPAQTAQNLAKRNIQANVEYATTDRFSSSAIKIYGSDAANEFMMQQHKIENELKKVPLTQVTNIIADVRDDSNTFDRSEPVIESNINKNNIILDDSSMI